MKVGIYGQFYHQDSGEYITYLLDNLHQFGVEIFVEKKFYRIFSSKLKITKKYETFDSYADLDNTFDLFFSIGGDGTILRTITLRQALNIPILGINTGRLGFLATIQNEEIQDAISKLISKDFIVKARRVIAIETSPVIEDIVLFNFALTEFTVARYYTHSMIW